MKLSREFEITEQGRVIHPELGDLTEDVLAAFAEMEREERLEDAADRVAIAAERGRQERRNLEFGVVKLEVALGDYLRQEKLEPGCWSDKGFVEDFGKHVPEAKVVSRSDKIQVGYSGK